MSSSSGAAPPVPEWWDGAANVCYPYQTPHRTTELQHHTLAYPQSNIPRSRFASGEDVRHEYQAATEASARTGLSGGSASSGDNNPLEAYSPNAHRRRASSDFGYVAQSLSTANSPSRTNFQQHTYQPAAAGVFAYPHTQDRGGAAYGAPFSPTAGLPWQRLQPHQSSFTGSNTSLNASVPAFRTEQHRWQEQDTQFQQQYSIPAAQSNSQNEGEAGNRGISNILRNESKASRLPRPRIPNSYHVDRNLQTSHVERPNKPRAYSQVTPSHGTVSSEYHCGSRSDVNAALQRNDDQLAKDFQMRKKPDTFFCEGRVFSVLWAEPLGGTASISQPGVIPSRYGEWAFAKVRWFVVVQPGNRCCTALAITTYGQQAGSKAHIDRSELGIVYSTKFPPSPLPEEMPARGEEGNMMQPSPIQVHADAKGEKIDPLSRIHFGKVYTIEHNLKVKNFGTVSNSSRGALIHQWKSVWGRPAARSLQMQQSSLSPQTSRFSASAGSSLQHGRRWSGFEHTYGSRSSQAGSSTLEGVSENAAEDDDAAAR